jgi:hypothetical protein
MIPAPPVRESLAAAWVSGSRPGSTAGRLKPQEFAHSLVVGPHLLQAIFEGLERSRWSFPAIFVERHALSVRQPELNGQSRSP